MTERYHINTDTGRAGKCTASVKKCPYGGEDGQQNHFASKEEAKDNRERIMKELHGHHEATLTKSGTYDPEKTPLETDTKIVETYDELSKANGEVKAAIAKIRDQVGDQGKSILVGRKYKRIYEYKTEAELLEALNKYREGLQGQLDEAEQEGNTSDINYMNYRLNRVDESVTKLDEAQEKVGNIRNKLNKLEKVFEKNRWSRFFLVPDGHIHSSMNCSTCNNGEEQTKFGWLPQLSGKDEAKAVAEHGSRLCTVCYPSAPTEWTNFREQEAAAKKAAECPGSGTMDYVEGSTRFGYYTGNGGKCKHCSGWASVKSKNNRSMRTHKPANS